MIKAFGFSQGRRQGNLAKPLITERATRRKQNIPRVLKPDVPYKTPGLQTLSSCQGKGQAQRKGFLGEPKDQSLSTLRERERGGKSRNPLSTA